MTTCELSFGACAPVSELLCFLCPLLPTACVPIPIRNAALF